MLTKKERKQIVKLYKQGESGLTLQEKFGISYKTVYRILDDYGVKRRDNREKTLNAVKHGRCLSHEIRSKIAKKNWSGKNNPRWKEIGSKREAGGYILMKDVNGRWRKEEIIIAEKCLGRKLKYNEVVHHINGNKKDNRKSNLRVMTDKEHRAYHVLDNINKNKGEKIILKSNLI